MSTRATAMMLALKHADDIGASPDKTAGLTPMYDCGRLRTFEETSCKEASMQAQTINQARAKGLGRIRTRWAASAVAAALVACGTVGGSAATAASASPAGSAGASTLTIYAFDINNGTADPGFIPAPGTNPKAFAQGDELIINDQVTTTHKVGGGYPIIGRDAGVCTLTRIPEPHADQTLADCVA